jgi:hypothetical protein
LATPFAYVAHFFLRERERFVWIRTQASRRATNLATHPLSSLIKLYRVFFDGRTQSKICS